MIQPPAKKLFLVDATALAYRSHFAFDRNPLINSKGENTSAIFGFLNSLLKIMDEQQPDYLVAVFDPPGKTFRHEIYEEYKATRQKMPDEMSAQLPRIKQVLEALNIAIVEVPGLEADDVLAILARQGAEQGLETYLVTSDKDLRQLVSSHIKIYNPKPTGVEILGEAEVQQKMGVPPSKVADYLSLTGDSSDNVPGVPGIGPKTASELLAQFASLDDLYENLEKVARQSTRDKLAQHRDSAFLSRRLVTIDTDRPLPLEIDHFAVKPPHEIRAFELMKELEFNSLLDRFKPSSATQPQDYHTIENWQQFEDLLDQLRRCQQFTLDLETTDVDPMRAEIVGLSFSWQTGLAYYIPVESKRANVNDDLFSEKRAHGLALPKVLSGLKPILENPAIAKCGQNVKYDLLVLARAGVEVSGVDFDTMVASYVINPSLRQHNLDALALEYLNYQKIPTKELIGSGKNQINMADVPLAKISRYACEDADFTQRLRHVLEPKLVEYDLKKLFDDVEMPLIAVLMDMERTGVSLDVPYLNEMSKELEQRLNELIQNIYKIAGEHFNINSPKQLADVLFKKLKLPIIRKTKTGPSTDVSVLEVLARQHPLPLELLEYRQLAKLKSTYVDALPRLIHPQTGRVHTSYNQTVAATGRLSSSDPNLQNIPIRTEIGSRIRKAFVPRDASHVLLDADYSQIELRIMAHLSQDPTLIRAFQEGKDIHRETAALVFKVPPEEVTDDMRRRAKEVNFGIMYGMGAYGLASRLEIPQEEAEMFITSYFASYPRIQDFMMATQEFARQHGYVTTLLNRRRYLPDIHSDNRRVREFAERNAINTPIQGTAADLIKVAMINIFRRLRERKLASKMIMQVHDELVFEVPQGEVEHVKELVRTEMENAIELSVPIRVDIGVGDNWLAAH
ncbi:MAG: DNA polymerase I [candidate division KSB1 bacterium]|nr:DNA polymerase I [candidate division KSB1 bacterium]MDZ7318619.1 DNA polymerase I [candidate division KSB1 bacterium]MDZ7340894.1 DNA polymerase I [candidate division KSB1 bacterium]